jgi:predicted transcriptional regulator
LLLASGVSYGFTVLAMRRSIMTEKIARRGLHIYREYSVDPQERIFVNEVMTRNAASINADCPLHQTASLYFGITQQHRAYPVISSEGKVLGLLDRDMLRHALDEYDNTIATGKLFEQTELQFALPTETCQTVGRRMAALHLERLPVVADAESCKLIGIVSRSDLLKPSRTVFDEEHVRERIIGGPL